VSEPAGSGAPAADAGAGRRAAEAVAGAVGDVLTGLLAGLAELGRRTLRRPKPRVVPGGGLEIIALLALGLGLVAALVLLVDPATVGLRNHLPASVLVLAERLTDLGLGGVVLWPLGLALALVLALRPHLEPMGQRVASALVARLGFLFIAIAGAGLLTTTVKRIIGRARPHEGMRIGGADPQLVFDVMAWKASYASFPSGHSTTVFATAVAFAALFPRARRVLIALAVAVAATRVLLGAHFPSDVLAGAMVATTFVLWMVKVFAARRRVFRVDAQGAVAPMAGPSARRLGSLWPWRAPRPATLEEART